MKNLAEFKQQATIGTIICTYYPALKLQTKRKIINNDGHFLTFDDGARLLLEKSNCQAFLDDCLIECPLVAYTFAPSFPPCTRLKIQMEYDFAQKQPETHTQNPV